ncbi:TRAP transporter large permease [Ornithinibacillus halophilus]|uniref:TRAP transporter, DctM subunit n=1 Tax=Ornithinibacillus halophilus TaxID=930117 RepID=A0A1M5GLH5_9BACI|nr:TRAP transporter large permease [Ornithinibacillus halophilus]SHG04391.1 TRAP transporter, DctM subunit [Ornithinibacillus halophilus]
MEIAIAIILLVLFLIGGMPVGIALGVSGSVGLWLTVGTDSMLGILRTAPYEEASSFVLTTIPMFILMAEFMNQGQMTQKLFSSAYRWFGHLKGGMAISTVMASAGLAAVSGSSTASAAGMSSIAVPEMRKYGYDDKVSVGVVSVAGTLAFIIPPSTILIIYGILTESSIAKLFVAGVIPGVITVIGYCLAIYLWVRRRPEVAPSIGRFGWKERFSSLQGIWPVLLLALAVIVAIYTGFVTPTEAGAFGSFCALMIVIVLRKINYEGIKKALSSTIQITAKIFVIIIGAMIFGYFLTITNSIQNIINAIQSMDVNRWVILIIIVASYLLLGCVMDQLAIMFLTIPLTFPVIIALGFDPIWYGIVIAKTVEIGLATPPLGLNIFVASSAANVPLGVGFRGAARLIVADFIILVILIAFPVIVTWLPSLM